MGKLKQGPWWLLTAVGLCGCPQTVEADDACNDTCQILQTCGLLPSFLGVKFEGVDAQKNCVARCSATPPAQREPIVGCVPEGQPGNLVAGWCDDGICNELSNCMSGNLPGEPVTGTASVQIEPWAPPAACERPSKTAPMVSYCESDAGRTSPEGCPWELDPDVFCSKHSTSIQAFVTQGEARTFAALRDCQHGMSVHSVFSTVRPGRLTAGVRLLVDEKHDGGTVSDAAVAGPRCLEFTEDVIVRAGAGIALVAVEVKDDLAGALGCEVCEDGADNDDDGLVDCDDDQCLLECQRSSATADAGPAEP